MESLDQSLDAYIDRVTNLPPAPVILPQLLTLLHEPDVDSTRVVDLIACDTALTAAVLRLCNSAFLAAATPASTLLEGVLRLGFNRVFELVVAILGARTLRRPQKGYGIDQGELWRHSVATALAARSMARDHDVDPSLAFTAAILHDLGKIVLAQALEQSYSQLVHQIQANQASLLESEAAILGVQHAQIGGRLLARWNFPDPLVAAVWNHHDPATAAGFEQLTSLVYLGNMISHFMGFGYGHQAFALRGRAEALSLAGIKPQELPQYMIETFDRLGELEAMVTVKT
jgi:putative nucleotidyltransferase with HDIG domain